MEGSFAFKDAALESHFQQNVSIIKVEKDYYDEATSDLSKENINKSILAVCHICGFESIDKSTFRKHKERNHSTKDLFENGKPGHVNITIKSEEPDDYIKNKSKVTCSYKGCGYTGRRESDLKYHFLQDHIKDKSFNCSQCKYVANFKGNLQRHIKNMHAVKTEPQSLLPKVGKPIIPCVLLGCSYQARASYDLKIHRSRKHETKHETFINQQFLVNLKTVIIKQEQHMISKYTHQENMRQF